MSVVNVDGVAAIQGLLSLIGKLAKFDQYNSVSTGSANLPGGNMVNTFNREFKNPTLTKIFNPDAYQEAQALNQRDQEWKLGRAADKMSSDSALGNALTSTGWGAILQGIENQKNRVAQRENMMLGQSHDLNLQKNSYQNQLGLEGVRYDNQFRGQNNLSPDASLAGLGDLGGAALQTQYERQIADNLAGAVQGKNNQRVAQSFADAAAMPQSYSDMIAANTNNFRGANLQSQLANAQAQYQMENVGKEPLLIVPRDSAIYDQQLKTFLGDNPRSTQGMNPAIAQALGIDPSTLTGSGTSMPRTFNNATNNFAPPMTPGMGPATGMGIESNPDGYVRVGNIMYGPKGNRISVEDYAKGKR